MTCRYYSNYTLGVGVWNCVIGIPNYIGELMKQTVHSPRAFYFCSSTWRINSPVTCGATRGL